MLIHCYHGVWRTGVIAYLVLRFLGYSKSASLDILWEIRPLIFDSLTEDTFWIDIVEETIMKWYNDEKP